MALGRRGWSTAFTAGAIVLLALACSGIRADELDCEDAVGHLQECCPGFKASNITCTYSSNAGCLLDDDGEPNLPDFSTSQSQCIRSEGCDELRSSGVCTRAAQIPYSLGPTTYEGVGILMVCP